MTGATKLSANADSCRVISVAQRLMTSAREVMTILVTTVCISDLLGLLPYTQEKEDREK